MTWTPTPTTDAHRQALRGHEVVGVLNIQIPFVAEAAVVEVASRRALTVLEEFTVRAVLEVDGLKDAADISDLLGLGQPSFVEPIVSRLGQTGLVRGRDGGPLAPGDGLRELYERRAWEEINRATASGFLCSPTGQRFAEVEGLADASEAPAMMPPPDPNAFADWATSGDGPLAQVDRDRVRGIAFEERVDGVGLECEAVVYTDDQDGTWYWEPYLPGQGRVAVEFREACRALGVEDAALEVVRSLDEEAPPEPPAESEARARTEAVRAMPGLRRLGTTEARAAMLRRIASARREVIATFPWIKSGAVTDDLLAAIQKALSRGASVYIGYGIAASEDDEDSHPQAVERLRSLHAPQTGETAHVVWVGHSHVKELVVDGTHYFNGSFNLLSFRGDPDWDSGVIRRETMTHVHDEVVAGNARDAVVPEIQAALVRQVGTAPVPDDAAAWLARWRPVFKLAWMPEVLRAALSGAPESAGDRADVLVGLVALMRKSSLLPDTIIALVESVEPDFVGSGSELPELAVQALRGAVGDLESDVREPLPHFRVVCGVVNVG